MSRVARLLQSLPLPDRRGFAVVLVLVAGCGGEPQIASQNRELIVSLATAISSRNTEWLESNAKALEEQRSRKLCSETEYKTFLGIIERARSGDWKGAEEAIYALRDAQQPTAEDLQNLAARKLAPEHHQEKAKPRRGGTGPLTCW